MGQTRSIGLACAAGLLALLASVGSAAAVTFTYVNSGPADSRVYVGFFNNASGNMTSDLVADPAAYSRNDTQLGPLSPPGRTIRSCASAGEHKHAAGSCVFSSCGGEWG